MAIDETRLQMFMGQAVSDLGATLNSALVLMGEKLGLYKAMAGAGPLKPEDLAARTDTTERYVREWLNAQAAGGYVTYDAATGTYSLPEEQASALADETSPFYLLGGFQIVNSVFRDEPKIREAFRTGQGVGWHDHDHALFEGTERFFRPNYRGHLLTEWIPALDGMEARLHAGARVADVGCGYGASTILLAEAFPKSTFVGYDYHDMSIQAARDRAQRAGVEERVEFHVATAKNFPGKGYDLVAFFDCLHDMGDPVGAAAHAKKALKPDGVLMVVEPQAGDRVEDNLNPVGRIFYCASTMICTPASLSQEVGLGLGAQAGESRLRGILHDAGFSVVRRAAETPFNMVLEARP